MATAPHIARPRRLAGFTLVELLVTLAVAAILLAAAAPDFSDLVSRNRRDATVYRLIGDLQFARSEAIKRGTRVSVCGARTDGAEGCGPDWAGGWTVFVDTAPLADGGTAGTLDADEEVLRSAAAAGGRWTVQARARTMTNAAAATSVGHVRFGPRGTSSWRGGGTFRFCDAQGDADTIAALNVGLMGDVRRARRDASDELVDAFGATIACPAVENA